VAACRRYSGGHTLFCALAFLHGWLECVPWNSDIAAISTISRAFEKVLSPLLLICGFLYVWERRHKTLLLYLFGVILLLQTRALGIPFFQFRFVEFLGLPLGIGFTLGLAYISQHLGNALARFFLLLTALVVMLPFNLHEQRYLRSCYIHYCVGLHPANLLEADYKAFQWIHAHTHPSDRIVAVAKFGLFLPAIAYRSVAMPVHTPNVKNDAHLVLSDPSQEQRWLAAQRTNARYVFWDALFDSYQATYEPYKVYSERFSDPKLFRLVYSKDGARIYEVLQ
jgi:hypothetical protein